MWFYKAEEVNRAASDPSASGDNTIIAAQGGTKRIAVLGYALQGKGTVNAKFTDGAGGSQLSLTWNFQAREGSVVPTGTEPLWIGSANTALVLNLSGSVECGVEVTWVALG